MPFCKYRLSRGFPYPRLYILFYFSQKPSVQAFTCLNVTTSSKHMYCASHIFSFTWRIMVEASFNFINGINEQELNKSKSFRASSNFECRERSNNSATNAASDLNKLL